MTIEMSVERPTETSPYVILRKLQDVREKDMGCKGARIHALQSIGLQTPVTWLVPVPFQFEVMALNKIKKLRDFENMAQIPTALLDDLTQLFAEDEQGLWVIRSSATTEDDHFACSAGGYDTFMHNNTRERAEKALLAVYRRLGDERIDAYLSQRGLNPDDQRMAVLIQKQIRTQNAGVCFTQSPRNESVARVEYCDGYGTAVVDGTGSPAWAEYGRAGVQVQDKSAAPPSFVTEAVHGALRAEEAFGGPQDVEFGWDGSRVVYFQARDAPEIQRVAERSFDRVEVSEVPACQSVDSFADGIAVGTLSLPQDGAWGQVGLGTVCVFDASARAEVPSAMAHNVSAVVSAAGGHLSHLAVVARELGVPMVGGVSDIANRIGQIVVVDAHAGTLVELQELSPERQKEVIFDSAVAYARRDGSSAVTKNVCEAVLTDPLAVSRVWLQLSRELHEARPFVQEIHPYDLPVAVYTGVGARIQCEPGATRLQFKRAQAGVGHWRQDQEVHLNVSRDEAENILARLTYLPRPSQQRLIARWQWGSATYQFNLWPRATGVYLGIEAPDAETVQEALRRVGLDDACAKPLDGVDLFEQFGISLKDCVFGDQLPDMETYLCD